MRLKKGYLYVVHKTSNEIGDRLFHGRVLVCFFFLFGKDIGCATSCEFLTISCLILRWKILGRNLFFVQLPVKIYVSLPFL